MCTMTWCRGPEGYDVYFNRDERRTRLPAIPPSLETRHGVRYLAPTDPDAGGTWLLVNERGVTWGVANFYTRPMDIRPPARRSRGQLVRSLADTADLDQGQDRLAGETLDSYNPFVLVGIAPDGSAVRWIWDGEQLRSAPQTSADLPITTNPFDPREADRRRGEALRDWIRSAGGLQPEALRGFHGDHRGPDAAFDVLMWTRVAQTVSLSHIQVRAPRITFRYQTVDERRRIAAPGLERRLVRTR